MNGCLEGIRVLELGNFISGPYGAMLLADMGAEVIKVENPKGGDPFRGWDLGGDQPNFWAYNRGKKGITLNLQTPEGKEIFLALAKNADVVLDNYRPGVMKKLGIDYETVSKSNPGVIYLSITGTGPTGPYVKRPAYDTVGQGLGGMLSLLMDAKNPRPIGPNYADSLSGMFACIGVLGAIAARAKTGKGQQVDTTMAGSTLAFLIAPATDALATGKIPGPYTRPMQSQTYAFTGADGAMFAIHLSSPQKFWEGLCKAAGHPELIDDSRFNTRPNRRKNYNELAKVFGESFRRLFQRKAARSLDGAIGSERRAIHACLRHAGGFCRPTDQTHGPGDRNCAQGQAEYTHRGFPERIQRYQKSPSAAAPRARRAQRRVSQAARLQRSADRGV